MAQLLFHIDGMTRSRLKRLRRSTRAPHTRFAAAGWIAAGAAGIYGLGMLLPNMVAVLSGSPSAVIRGQLLIAKHVVLIRDVSGSMNEPARQKNLASQIERLKASGITVDEGGGTQGFGVSVTKHPENLFHRVAQALRAHPQVDLVYAFSDFELTGAGYWQSDAEGYRQLEKILVSQRARLYLGTVKYPPPPELLALARRSGGGLIE